jgi:hypothetical protein
MLRVSESHPSSLEDGRARAVSTKSICYRFGGAKKQNETNNRNKQYETLYK